MNRVLRISLLVSAIALVLLTIARMCTAWPNDSYLEHTSGTWVALADDLREGDFYRPVYSDLGYGGTRYFPLHFLLHAVLMKLGFEPRLAGHLIALVSMIMVLAGGYVLLKRLGADRTMAAGLVATVLASRSAQLAVLSVRGDVLATALNVWGLATCMTVPVTPLRLCGASLLFALAFATKQTSVFGLSAVIIAFLVAGQTKQALKLFAICCAGFGLTLLAMYFGSAGRIFGILRACSSTGSDLHRFLAGPLYFVGVIHWGDPQFLPFLVISSAAFLILISRKIVGIPTVLFPCTLVVTILIFSTPGTGENHLLDVQISALIAIGAWMERGSDREKEFTLALVVCATVLSLRPSWDQYRHRDRLPRKEGFEAALRIIGNRRGVILSENPLLPVLAGQRPYLLDPYMFRVLSEGDPSFARPLWDKLSRKEFSAVVLQLDPHSTEGQWWYRENFGSGFVQAAEANYDLAGVWAGNRVYLPRGD